MEKEKKVKSIKIKQELHKKLKLEATEKGVSIYSILEEIILDYYGTIKSAKL